MSPDEREEELLAEAGQPVYYCLACGSENTGAVRLCRECGKILAPTSRQRREGVTFFLNELEALKAQDAIPEDVYNLLRRRYREALGVGEAEAAPIARPVPAPRPAEARPPAEPAPARPVTEAAAAPAAPTVQAAPSARRPAPPSVPRWEVGEWLAEQQANLLLYLGAFLIIIATLIFVSRSEQALSDGVKMALLVVYTLLFLAAGLACLRFPAVRQAGVVFFAIGALMVPLCFAGAYAFFYADEDMDPTGLWLVGSLVSALFYGAVSMVGVGRWYPVPAAAAVGSSLAALLSLADAPPEAYPGSFITLALLLQAPSMWRTGKVSETFGQVWLWAAHAVVPAGWVAALVLAGVGSQEGADPSVRIGTLWFLPVTLLPVAVFYALPALRGMGVAFSAAAVVAGLSAFTSALAAAEVPMEVYPGSLIAAAFVLAVPSLVRLGKTSDIFGEAGFWIANAIVPAAAVWAIVLAGVGSQEGAEPGWQVRTLWFLPPTLLIAATFYGVLALARQQIQYSAAAVIGVLSAFTSTLVVAEVPAEAHPGSLIAAAFVLALPSLVRLGKVSNVFGKAGYWISNVLVPAAAVAAIVIAAAGSQEDAEAGWQVRTLWFLPATLLAAAAFHILLALTASSARTVLDTVTAPRDLERWHAAVAVLTSLSAFTSALAAAEVPIEAYPGSLIAAAFVLAAPSFARLGRISDVFGWASYWIPSVVVPAAAVWAVVLAGTGTQEGTDPGMQVSTLWFLPPTLLAAAAFYTVLALRTTQTISSAAAVLESVLALRNVERWHAAAAVVAYLSAFTSALAAAEVPIEAYPGSLIAAAFVLGVPSFARLGRISDVFGRASYWIPNLIVPSAAIMAALLPSMAENRATDWYLPPTLGIAAAFYTVFALTRTEIIGSAAAVLDSALALKHLERWHAAAAILTFLGAFLSLFVLADAPPEAYPGSFIALALLVAAPAILPLGRVSEAFGIVGSWTAHAVVPAGAIAALVIAGVEKEGGYGDPLVRETRWYLPPTGAIAALFYWTQALWARRAYPKAEPFLTFAALAVTGGAAVTLVYALEVGYQWYGPAVAIVGWLYAAGSEGFGPRWFGQRHLGWMALGAITVAWLCFEAIHADFPRHGAGVHFAATAFYLAAARVVKGQVDLLPFEEGSADGETAPLRETFRVPVGVAPIYAAGLTLGVGFYYLLASLPAAETAGASDLSMAFFGLSMGVAAVAATLRLWWPEVRLHAYAVALGMSLFVLLACADAEGQVALLLALYTGVALALALWERQPLALALPAAFGFFALLAAWRHYEPDDAFLPLAFSATGCALFACYAAVRSREAGWAPVLQTLAFIYAAAAPIVGWVRLGALADPEGFVGAESFEETVLYQTSAAAVGLLGLLGLAQSWFARHAGLATGASALLMVALLLEIGHFRPENVQAYTGPIGAYVLIAGLLASRARDLPKELRVLIEPVQMVGAAVLMGPNLVQSWEAGGWPYALILLAEGMVVLGLALLQRWVWLLSAATGFIVLDALRYLFEAARVLPNWLTLTVAGLLLLAAGMAILLGRDQWTRWQRDVRAWWYREPLPSGTK